MSGKAAKIKLTEKQLNSVKQLSRSSNAAKRLVQRSRLILLAFAGRLSMEIATEIGLDRRQVGQWRLRW